MFGSGCLGIFPHVGQLTYYIEWMRTDSTNVWIRLPGVFPQVGQLTYYIDWMRTDIGIRMPRVTTIIPYDWYVMYIITA